MNTPRVGRAHLWLNVRKVQLASIHLLLHMRRWFGQEARNILAFCTNTRFLNWRDSFSSVQLQYSISVCSYLLSKFSGEIKFVPTLAVPIATDLNDWEIFFPDVIVMRFPLQSVLVAYSEVSWDKGVSGLEFYFIYQSLKRQYFNIWIPISRANNINTFNNTLHWEN